MPVHLFIGANTYLKEEALEDLKSSFFKGASEDLDYKVFYAGETDLSQILDYAGTVPFFSTHRIAVIKDAGRFGDEDLSRLSARVKNLLKSTNLVLFIDEEDFLDRCAQLARSADVRKFDELTDVQFQSWARDFVRRNSGGRIKIADNAIRELKELHDKNLSVSSGELEKLITHAGDNSEITLKDVLDIAGRSLSYSAFDLTDAIQKHKLAEALRIVSDLVIAGKRHYEIIGLLCWHIKRLLRAKLLKSKGEPDYRIASALRIGRSYESEFFKQASDLRVSELKNKLKMLLEADLDIKRTRLNPTLTLEFVIMKLCLG